MTIEQLIADLTAGKSVTVRGLGRFSIKDVAARTYPVVGKPGETVFKAAHKAVKFKSAVKL